MFRSHTSTVIVEFNPAGNIVIAILFQNERNLFNFLFETIMKIDLLIQSFRNAPT